MKNDYRLLLWFELPYSLVIARSYEIQIYASVFIVVTSINPPGCLLNHCVFLMMQYIHIIRGEELYRLARDYTRYLVTGKRTARLKRSMQKWHNFSESFMQKEGSEEDQYEKPTWWQQPQKLVHLMEELCRGNWRPHAQES